MYLVAPILPPPGSIDTRRRIDGELASSARANWRTSSLFLNKLVLCFCNGSRRHARRGICNLRLGTQRVEAVREPCVCPNRQRRMFMFLGATSGVVFFRFRKHRRAHCTHSCFRKPVVVTDKCCFCIILTQKFTYCMYSSREPIIRRIESGSAGIFIYHNYVPSSKFLAVNPVCITDVVYNPHATYFWRRVTKTKYRG